MNDMTEARRLLIGDLIHKHCVPTKSYMLSFVVIKKCFARVQLTERRGISRSHRLMVVVHAQCNSKENLPYCSLSLSFKFFQQYLEPQYTTQYIYQTYSKSLATFQLSYIQFLPDWHGQKSSNQTTPKPICTSSDKQTTCVKSLVSTYIYTVVRKHLFN